MSNRIKRVFPVAIAFASMAYLPAGAAGQDRSSHPCAEIGDAATRLACYDRAFPPTEKAQEEAARGAVAAFGRERAREASGVDAVGANDAGPDQVQAVVTSVTYGPRQQRVIGLDNGQVWAQTESRSSGLVREGDTVTVRKAAFGTYMLSTGSVALRVRRVR
ncbi:hypothetical protein [Luteimonas wenzhouensis]|uniref:Type IV pilus biogenesis protein PilP n=1 Tax=Luteimonas wenzhouensis TaxID=2599615 RepID=A0A5C5U4G9_9GAMM|nr:hypothetical protein [Luteimonas wenzhouensis]TWT20917.1 hypothetical protein FQY79_06385 [Luteimonas wenzhouensis]